MYTDSNIHEYCKTHTKEPVLTRHNVEHGEVPKEFEPLPWIACTDDGCDALKHKGADHKAQDTCYDHLLQNTVKDRHC